ncbi:hypothetical protein Tco_0740564 [Tanacetum coccineum]
MSADSAVTYTSVHSEARSWSIPSEDPYEEAAQQLFEQAPRSPEPGCEVGESSAAAAAARQPGPTIETRLRDTERRMMTALEMVNRRVSYQVDIRSRESSEFHTRHHDAQKDRAAVRAEIKVLRRERLAYEQESIQTRQDLARSEAHCRALEARVTVLETDVRRHEWQRQAADDLAVQYIMRTQALEARAPYRLAPSEMKELLEQLKDLARSEAHCRALEARVTVLETDVRRHEWQRQAADDLAVQYIMRT